MSKHHITKYVGMDVHKDTIVIAIAKMREMVKSGIMEPSIIP